MKKYWIGLFVFMLLAGCTRKAPAPNEEKIYGIVDYYPFRENTLYIYGGEGNEFAEKQVFFDYIQGNRAQLRVMNPGTVLAQVVEIGDGQLRRSISHEEQYHYENRLDREEEMTDILLMEPLQEGTAWTLVDGMERSITGVNVEIETPMGNYRALEVTTIMGEDAQQLDYYVVNVGHVKSIYKSGEYEILTVIEGIIQDQPLEQEMTFFYPPVEQEGNIYVERTILIETNEDILQVLEEQMKNPPAQDIRSSLSQNTKIIKITREEEKDLVLVDFNRALLEDMNVGSYGEEQVLQSIVNTFGTNYNVNNVYISVEGKPYQSGHFELREGEYFTVRMDNSKKYGA